MPVGHFRLVSLHASRFSMLQQFLSSYTLFWSFKQAFYEYDIEICIKLVLNVEFKQFEIDGHNLMP